MYSYLNLYITINTLHTFFQVQFYIALRKIKKYKPQGQLCNIANDISYSTYKFYYRSPDTGQVAGAF